jgi:hypothetical protein
MLNDMRKLPGAGVLIGAKKGLFLARTTNGALKIEPAGNTETGQIDDLLDLPGAGVLIRAEKGWFLARAANGAAAIEPAGTADTGRVNDTQDLPGVGRLIGAENGLFLVRNIRGGPAIAPAGHADTGPVYELHDWPGTGVLIRARDGLFLARAANGTAEIEPADLGHALSFTELSGAGILIGTEKGLYLGRVVGGTAKFERVDAGDIGFVYDFYDFGEQPGTGVLIGADNGVFLARVANGTVKVERVDRVVVHPGLFGTEYQILKLPGTGALIRGPTGWLHVRLVNGGATMEPAGHADTGEVRTLRELPGAGLLIGANNGLFLARTTNGTLKIERIGNTDTRSVNGSFDLPGGGVMIVAEKGWFQARAANGAAAIEAVGVADTGKVFGLHYLPVGVLIGAEKGLFVARMANGTGAIGPVGNADTGPVRNFLELSGTGVLLQAAKGMFLATQAPLSGAKVRLRDREALDGGLPDPTRDMNVVFTMVHECAGAADKLGLRLRVKAPGDISGTWHDPQAVRRGATEAEVAVPLRFNIAGEWSFQLVSIYGGSEREVGTPQVVSIKKPVDVRSWLERWGWWLSGGAALLLILVNAALFVFARRSAWAWRVATDDGLSTWILRIATLALSHIPKAQIWILDLFFCRRRSKLLPAAQFLPLPLSGGDGGFEAGDRAVAPPWTGRRLWIQGNSGMGKTALFRHITEAHFRCHNTAFAAFARWGCIVVAFSARDFAGDGEDKHDATWVIDAVRATLSSQNLTFAHDKLLRRFLESGTIGVAIDGLNEVGRTMAVTAFSEAFADAPMLVTSQEPGGQRFTTWRLPADIRAFTEGLLQEYLGEDAAATVMKRISASGLKDAIRSGYDVRLIIDLVRSDPHNAPLPADRLELYAAVIAAGWPEGTEEARREQLSRTAAAAWRMTSERKPNEDMRRLKPGIDLAADLLQALSDAPEKDGKPVRLIRRVTGGEFEFVHDQMHAYLAALWFAQDGLSVAELEDMLKTSTIWIQAPETRRTLWGFAAALLDDERLTALWARVEDKEDWDALRRALKAEAERRMLRQVEAVTDPSYD